MTMRFTFGETGLGSLAVDLSTFICAVTGLSGILGFRAIFRPARLPYRVSFQYAPFYRPLTIRRRTAHPM